MKKTLLLLSALFVVALSACAAEEPDIMDVDDGDNGKFKIQQQR
jgi:hypothetical protein